MGLFRWHVLLAAIEYATRSSCARPGRWHDHVVGFWGTLVVHRGERLLWELLPQIRQVDDAELCYDGVARDWQVTRVFPNLERLPRDVVATVRGASGASVLAASVWDSDAAYVVGMGLRTPDWRTWLRLDLIIDHAADYEQAKASMLAEASGGTIAASAAFAWATEAGLELGSVDEVTGAFDGDDTLVEDLFSGCSTGSASPPTMVRNLHSDSRGGAPRPARPSSARDSEDAAPAGTGGALDLPGHGGSATGVRPRIAGHGVRLRSAVCDLPRRVRRRFSGRCAAPGTPGASGTPVDGCSDGAASILPGS